MGRKGRAVDGRNIYFLFSYFFPKHEWHLCRIQKVKKWSKNRHLIKPYLPSELTYNPYFMRYMPPKSAENGKKKSKNFKLLYKQHLIILIHVYHQRCPNHISNLFKLNREINVNTRTRQADGFVISPAKLKTTIDSPIIQVPKLYNTYKKKLNFHCLRGSLKRNLYKMLLSTYNKNLDR